jgi:hypothetical protein
MSEVAARHKVLAASVAVDPVSTKECLYQRLEHAAPHLVACVFRSTVTASSARPPRSLFAWLAALLLLVPRGPGPGSQ